MSKNKESLTTDQPTMLKQVDVEPLSAYGGLKRSQNRVDTVQKWLDDLNPKTVKKAIFGYNTQAVEHLLSNASDLIVKLSADNQELQEQALASEELSKDGLRTGINSDTVPPEHQLQRHAEEVTALTLENQSLREKLDALTAKAEADQSEKTDLQTKLNELQQHMQTLESPDDNAAFVEVQLETALENLKQKEVAYAALEEKLKETTSNLHKAQGDSKAALENAYAELGEVMMDAKRKASEQVAEASRAATKIKSDAELTAQETRDKANTYYQERVAEAKNEALHAYDEANDMAKALFEEVAKARKDLIIGHNAIAERARLNQNRMLDAMVQQRDLLEEQVNLSTSDDLNDILNTTSKQLENAEQVLLGRQKQVLYSLSRSAEQLSIN